MPSRILSFQFSHECNTFSSTLTDRSAFQQRVFVEGDAAVRARFQGTRTELGAHMDAAERYGWTLVQPFAAHATPSGRVTTDMLDYAVRMATQAAKNVDGALLALHGAMVAQKEEDAEGCLLQALRKALGPDKPIVITLDLHANVTQRMADNANAIIAFRTYPHIDQYEVGAEGAELLERMLRSRQLTTTHLFKPPLLDGCDHGRTHGNGPMSRLLGQARHIQAQHAGLDVISITAGFPWADIAEVGPAVTASTTASRAETAQALAPLMDEIWRTRDERSIDILDLNTLVQALRDAAPSSRPVVVSDFSDNPGHGAPGDGVAVIRALVEGGIRDAAVATVCDPAAVQECHRAGAGAVLDLEFGARIYPAIYGAPLRARCRVLKVGDGELTQLGPMRKGMKMSLGPTATIQIEGVTVVLATHNLQVADLAYFYANGVDPLAQKVLVVKSQQHFRAAFEPIAAQVLLTDSGGFVSPNVTKLPYKAVRRPIYPLDRDAAPAAYA